MFKVLEDVKFPVSVKFVTLHSVCCPVFWSMALPSQNLTGQIVLLSLCLQKHMTALIFISSRDLCPISDEVCIQSSIKFLKLNLLYYYKLGNYDI